MAFTNLPIVFSARLKENLQNALVFGKMANTDYEGEVLGGQSVKITNFNEVSVGDYDTQSGLTAPEQIGNTQLSLTVDQFKAFNFFVDSIEKVQRNLPMLEKHMKSAANGLAAAHDLYIASKYTEAHADNRIGTDAAPVELTTPESVYDMLVEMGVKLDEKNVAQGDRAVALTPALVGLLRKDARFTKYDGVLLNGVVGEAAGFTIHMTNNAPVVIGDGAATFSNTKVIAMHKSAITFAEQLQEIVKYNPESRFGEAVKGLSAFGAKAIYPEAIVVASVKK